MNLENFKDKEKIDQLLSYSNQIYSFINKNRNQNLMEYYFLNLKKLSLFYSCMFIKSIFL